MSIWSQRPSATPDLDTLDDYLQPLRFLRNLGALSWMWFEAFSLTGLLALHGLHFDIASGTVLALDEEADNFAPLPENDGTN